MSGNRRTPVPATAGTEGELLEVFSSIQGEGLLVGRRQVFVRLARCNLACAYCDTPFEPRDDCRVEDAPGSGNFRSIPNPVALETLSSILAGWQRELPGVHHSLSLTGGEPLLQQGMLAEWLPVLRRLLPIHLETNGTLPEALAELLPHLDWIAMDLKFASLTALPTPWEAHRAFLRLAAQRPCCVKAVVGEETEAEEIDRAAALLHEAAPQVPLILQPVTREGQVAISGRTLLDLQTRAARHHPPVLVIPQTHRFLDLV